MENLFLIVQMRIKKHGSRLVCARNAVNQIREQCISIRHTCCLAYIISLYLLFDLFIFTHRKYKIACTLPGMPRAPDPPNLLMRTPQHLSLVPSCVRSAASRPRSQRPAPPQPTLSSLGRSRSCFRTRRGESPRRSSGSGTRACAGWRPPGRRRGCRIFFIFYFLKRGTGRSSAVLIQTQTA